MNICHMKTIFFDIFSVCHKKIDMSNKKLKRVFIESSTILHSGPTSLEQLPETCRKSVRTHINNIYVGTVIRLYDQNYGRGGQLNIVHWSTNGGLFVTLHQEQRCTFIDLKYTTWVVDLKLISTILT